MPALAPVVDAIEQVPESARSFYVPKDGKFVLDLAGAPAGFVPATELTAANAKVVEFRDTNINLLKEVETLRPLKTQFEGIDPAAARAALEKNKALEGAGVKDTTDLQKMIEAAVAPFVSKVTELSGSITAERERADTASMRSVIGEKFIKAGGEAGALDFIMDKAKPVFTVEGGVVKARPAMFSEQRPGEPISIEEWLAKQTKENAFAFAKSGGGGASPTPGGGGLPRTGVTVIRNPTSAQLGDRKIAAELKAGRVRFEYDPVG